MCDTTFISALSCSRLGRLKYDRNWLDSKDNVKALVDKFQEEDLMRFQKISLNPDITPKESKHVYNLSGDGDNVDTKYERDEFEAVLSSKFNILPKNQEISIDNRKIRINDKTDMKPVHSDSNISDYETRYIQMQKKWDDIMKDSVRECVRRIQQQRKQHDLSLIETGTESPPVAVSEDTFTESFGKGQPNATGFDESEQAGDTQALTANDYEAQLLQILNEKLQGQGLKNLPEMPFLDTVPQTIDESDGKYSEFLNFKVELPTIEFREIHEKPTTDATTASQNLSQENTKVSLIDEKSDKDFSQDQQNIEPPKIVNFVFKVKKSTDESSLTNENGRIKANFKNVEAKRESFPRILQERQLSKIDASPEPIRNKTLQSLEIDEIIVPPKFEDSVIKEGYQEYLRLKQFLDERHRYLDSFVKDSSMKILRSEITMAVTSVLNMLSGVNFRENLNKLRLLLRNETVVSLRTYNVSLKKHTKAPAFCKDLICKRLVHALEVNLNASPMAIFYSAAMAVALCSEFVELKDYMLAHLYKKCPYLVPFYISSQQEHVISPLVELNEKGKPITQDFSEKNVAACARFFAALLITPTPPVVRVGSFKLSSARPGLELDQGGPHPFGLRTGWSLVASLARLTPRFQITALVLHEIFKIAGYSLSKKYGPQFDKLVTVLNVDLLPKILASSQGFPSGGASYLELKRILELREFDQQYHTMCSRIWSMTSSQAVFNESIFS